MKRYLMTAVMAAALAVPMAAQTAGDPNQPAPQATDQRDYGDRDRHDDRHDFNLGWLGLLGLAGLWGLRRHDDRDRTRVDDRVNPNRL